ncbi:MAG: hypothetical protein KDB00_29680 [Planctomycetales bacterium]|nr:hypothetical protein [Planctomycetales bacterium]
MHRNSCPSRQSIGGIETCNPTGGLQWLVSVRDLVEAEQTRAFGVDILDLKEPHLGALAPVSAGLWRDVIHWSQEQSDGRQSVPLLSAALGEPQQAISVAHQLPREFSFAKVGPSGCTTIDQISAVWAQTRARLPQTVELVAVAYADYQAAGTLPPEQILTAAASHGFRRILLDTFSKRGRSAIDSLGAVGLAQFGRSALGHQLWWSLAGAIRLCHVRQISTLFPDRTTATDCIAFRGNVCHRDHQGALSNR